MTLEIKAYAKMVHTTLLGMHRVTQCMHMCNAILLRNKVCHEPYMPEHVFNNDKGQAVTAIRIRSKRAIMHNGPDLQWFSLQKLTHSMQKLKKQCWSTQRLRAADMACSCRYHLDCQLHSRRNCTMLHVHAGWHASSCMQGLQIEVVQVTSMTWLIAHKHCVLQADVCLQDT